MDGRFSPTITRSRQNYLNSYRRTVIETCTDIVINISSKRQHISIIIVSMLAFSSKLHSALQAAFHSINLLFCYTKLILRLSQENSTYLVSHSMTLLDSYQNRGSKTRDVANVAWSCCVTEVFFLPPHLQIFLVF